MYGPTTRQLLLGALGIGISLRARDLSKFRRKFKLLPRNWISDFKVH